MKRGRRKAAAFDISFSLLAVWSVEEDETNVEECIQPSYDEIRLRFKL